MQHGSQHAVKQLLVVSCWEPHSSWFVPLTTGLSSAWDICAYSLLSHAYVGFLQRFPFRISTSLLGQNTEKSISIQNYLPHWSPILKIMAQITLTTTEYTKVSTAPHNALSCQEEKHQREKSTSQSHQVEPLQGLLSGSGHVQYFIWHSLELS